LDDHDVDRGIPLEATDLLLNIGPDFDGRSTGGLNVANQVDRNLAIRTHSHFAGDLGFRQN
jgi:hypothetical protein